MDSTIHVKSGDDFTIEVGKHNLSGGSAFYVMTIFVDNNTFKLFFNDSEYHLIEKYFSNYVFTDHTQEA